MISSMTKGTKPMTLAEAGRKGGNKCDCANLEQGSIIVLNDNGECSVCGRNWGKPKNPHAVAMGKLGGRSKSPAKLKAVRENLKLANAKKK